MTEGSEPVGSSLLLPAQGAGTSRSAVGSPCQAVPIVSDTRSRNDNLSRASCHCWRGSRRPNSTSAGLILRGLGAEICISRTSTETNMSEAFGQGHVCPRRTPRRVGQWPAAS